MVLDTQPRQYVSIAQFGLLKKKRALGQKAELTTPLWLTAQQAKDLGYNAGEDDFLLEPQQPQGKSIFGKAPTPPVPTEPVEPPLTPTGRPVSPSPSLETLVKALFPEKFTKPKVGMDRVADIGIQIADLNKEWIRTGDARIKGQIVHLSAQLQGLSSYGYKQEEQLPEAILRTIQTQIQLDPEQFLRELRLKNKPLEAEALLKMLGADQGLLDLVITPQQKETQLTQTLENIPQFEGLGIEGLANLIETDPQGFQAQLIRGKWTREKADLLRIMGFNEAEIEQVKTANLAAQGVRIVEENGVRRAERIPEPLTWDRVKANIVSFIKQLPTLFGELDLSGKLAVERFMKEPTGDNFKLMVEGVGGLAFGMTGNLEAGFVGKIPKRGGKGKPIPEQVKAPEIPKGKVTPPEKVVAPTVETKPVETGVAGVKEGVPKEAWQMTQSAFLGEMAKPPGEISSRLRPVDKITKTENIAFHKQLVEDALSEGKPVPAEVLADYPDLAKAVPEKRTPKIKKIPSEMTLAEFGQYRADLFKKGQNPWGGLSNKAALDAEIIKSKAVPELTDALIKGGRDLVASIEKTKPKYQFGDLMAFKEALAKAETSTGKARLDALKTMETLEPKVRDIAKVQGAKLPTAEAGIPKTEIGQPEAGVKKYITEKQAQSQYQRAVFYADKKYPENVTKFGKEKANQIHADYVQARWDKIQTKLKPEPITAPAKVSPPTASLADYNKEVARSKQVYEKVLRETGNREKAFNAENEIVTEARQNYEALTPPAEVTTKAGLEVSHKTKTAGYKVPEPAELRRLPQRLKPTTNWQPSGRLPGTGVPKPLSPQKDAYQKLVDAVTPTKADKLGDVRKKFLSQWYDRLDAFRGLENKTKLPVHQLAQIVSGASAYGEDLIRLRVRPILRGLTNNEVKALEELMVARRGHDILARFKGSQLPGGLSGWGDLLEAEATLKAKIGQDSFAKIEQAAKKLWELNDELVLKPMLDEGILSPDSYRAIKANNPHYIDFHREDFSVVDQAERMVRGEASLSDTGIRVLQPTGSVRKLDNPLVRSEMQVIKTQTLISRNRAAKAVVAGLQQLQDKTGETLVKYLKAGEGGEHSELIDTISFFFEGQKVTVEVPRMYAEAAKNMDAEFGNAITNFMQALATPLRAGATTYNPAFTIINPMRDAISAWYREKLIPFEPAYLQGWWAALSKNKLFSDVAKEGVFMSGLVETQRSTAQLAAKATRGALAIKNPKDAIAFIPRLIQEVNVIGERATRIATYTKLKNQGVDNLAAAIRARDVSVDFAKSGTTMRLINQILPFTNAGVQGAANTLRVIKHKPAWAVIASAPLGITSVVAFVNNQRFETSKNIPEYEYRYNWIFQIGEGKDKEGEKFPIYIKVPKGAQGGLLTAPVETFLRVLWGSDDRSIIDEFLSTTGSMLTALSPIEPTLSGIMPPGLSTAVGLATNQDMFRGAPIVPQSEMARLPEQQFGTDTSKFAVALGQQFKVSPRLVDFAIKDYTAGTGELVSWVAGLGLEALGYNPEEFGAKAETTANLTATQEMARTPVVRRFLGTRATQQENLGWEKFNDTTRKTNREFSQIEDMDALGIRLGNVGDSINNIELTIQERAEYQKQMAELVTSRINKLIATEKYQDAMDNDKHTMLQTVMRKAKSDASDKFLPTIKIEGRRARTLAENLASAEGRLGSIEQKGDLGQPDKLYEMVDLDTKLKLLLKGVEKGEVKNPSLIVESWYLKEDIARSTAGISSKVLKGLNDDPKKGATFNDLYEQWQERRKITDEQELEEFDKKFPNAKLGNFNKRELALLQERAELSGADRKKFDKDHPEISINKLEEYYKAHPDENAVMALWGDDKVLSKDAYTAFQKLVEELDIVDAALPNELRIPKALVDNYFKYQEAEDHSSPEIKLMLKKDDKLREFLGRSEITEPTKALELMVANKANYDKYDSYANEDSPDYIADADKRRVARQNFLQAHPEFVQVMRKVDVISKGTDAQPVPDEIVKAHLDYQDIQDKPGVGSSSAESMLYRVDNPEYDQWRQDRNIWGDSVLQPVDQTKIPVWRIDVKWAKQDEEYGKLPTVGDARDDYLAKNETYRKDRRRREAYQKGLTTQVENYVSYYELPIKGYRQERYLQQNPDLADALGLAIKDKIPSEQYDILDEKMADQDEEYEALKGIGAQRQYLADNTDYADDRHRRDAYKLYVPDDQIENYVSYKTLPSGRYEDDWFMMENMDFYREVYLGVLGKDRLDFRKTPTREVGAKYLEYQNLPTDYWRDLYRQQNPDLDAWGVIAFGWKPIKGQKTKKEASQRDIVMRQITEKDKEFDEKMAALRGAR